MNTALPAPAQPALVAIDWGSSKLRVALLDAQGRVLSRRESAAGVFAVRDGDFASALWPLCADWVQQHRVPLLACGMIGSRQGLLEVPYLPCPAGAAELARALGRAELPPPASAVVQALAPAQAHTLYIAPGLQTGSASTGHDVLRGEETQLLGISDATASLFVLPGTHSKWMAQSQSAGTQRCVQSFQTYMTGELFDLLRTHSTLARVMADPQHPGQDSPQAFAQGVAEARDGALEELLFRVRTAGLMGRWPAHALADYLSGLLIGAEVKAGLRRFDSDNRHTTIAVLGAAPLTQRYAVALAAFGRSAQQLPGDAVFNGLMLIARKAGLVQIPREAGLLPIPRAAGLVDQERAPP